LGGCTSQILSCRSERGLPIASIEHKQRCFGSIKMEATNEGGVRAPCFLHGRRRDPCGVVYALDCVRHMGVPKERVEYDFVVVTVIRRSLKEGAQIRSRTPRAVVACSLLVARQVNFLWAAPQRLALLLAAWDACLGLRRACAFATSVASKSTKDAGRSWSHDEPRTLAVEMRDLFVRRPLAQVDE